MNRRYIQDVLSNFRWRLLLSFMAILGWQSSSYGQEGSSKNPAEAALQSQIRNVKTPAAASLMKNIVYPMGNCTGLPEIKIPLYEVHSGEITLPIYLTYHASGIKLNDVAGWAGLGWNLVAEPMITRTVQGRADDPLTMTCNFDRRRGYGDGCEFYQYQLTKYSTEEPDEYYYRLADKQGMFMYSMEPRDKSRQFLPLPYENIRIDWTGNFFQITDDDGTLYKFDGSRDIGGSSLDLIAWKASSIVAANRKDSLTFVYDDWTNRYITELYSDYITVKDSLNARVSLDTLRTDVPISCTIAHSLPDEWMQDPILFSKVNNKSYSLQCRDNGELFDDGLVIYDSTQKPHVYTDSQPLREILFDQGKLVFTQNNKFRRVEKLTVFDRDGEFVREICFNYITPNERVTTRFFLESVVIKDKQGAALETYAFGYYNHQYLPVPGSRAIDYWGYFNGVYRKDNETLVPAQTISVTRDRYSVEYRLFYRTRKKLTIGSQLSRESDEKYMVYGTLSSITYPAGSKDEFIYEANRYQTPEGETRYAGGLRIKQIKTMDANGEMRVRTFKYGANEDGFGVPATTRPLDYFYLNQGMYLGDPLIVSYAMGRTIYEYEEGTYWEGRHRTFFGYPVRSMTFDGGATVMYEYVTEYNGTPEHNSGKTVSEYLVKRTLPPPIELHTLREASHDGWIYGNLCSQTIYENNNGRYIPLESTSYGRDYGSRNFGKIITGEASSMYVVRESASKRITPECFYRQTEDIVGVNLLTSITRTVYTDEKPLVTITRYEYADPSTTYPTRIIEKGPDGSEYITNLTYPQDYGDVFPYKDMVRRNILRPVVRKEYIRSQSYLGIETPYVVPFENVYKPGSTVIRRSDSDAGETRASYLYDDRGNVRQETLDGNTHIVYLYGYSYQHVIAIIENATYEEVVEQLGGEHVIEAMGRANSANTNYYQSLLRNLRQSLPAARVTSYTYKPLTGIASLTDPSGLTTCYDYDDLGRLVKTSVMNGYRQEVIEKQEYHYANQ